MEYFLWFLGGTFFGSTLACMVLSAVMLSSWNTRIDEAEERAEKRAEAIRKEAGKWGKQNLHRIDFGHSERKGNPWGKED